MANKNRLVIYPGSFDPVTNGHLDIVQRACRLFDHVVVAVSTNSLKKCLFTLEERRELLELALKPLIQKGKVSVQTFEGMLVHFALKKGAMAVVRGLRAISDFDFEFQMALMNRHQSSKVETVFLMPDEKYTYLSSTILKEIVRLGGKVNRFVAPVLVPKIRKKLATLTPSPRAK